MDTVPHMPRSQFVIEGGQPISGTLEARGNKNAALPLLAAALLTDEEVTLRNVPRIRDVEAQIGLLRQLGAEAGFVDADTVKVCAAGLGDEDPDPELCRAIRASILLAGPLLARRGAGRHAAPGRRRDRPAAGGHARAGARGAGRRHRTLSARRPGVPRREGGRPACTAPRSSSTKRPSRATENAVMAASLATGETRILNAAGRAPRAGTSAGCCGRWACASKASGRTRS